MSTTTVPAAATGLASAVAIDPVSLLLGPQCSSSSVGSDGMVRRLRSTEEILNFLKMNNIWTQKTLEQNNSTLSASTPDLTKSWCLLDGGICEGHPPIFMEVLPGPVLPDDHTVH